MGQSVVCAARVDGQEDDGTALLETDEVIFRGGRARARVPFQEMNRVEVRGGWLVIAYGKDGAGSLELELDARAPAWREKIRSPKGLGEKLGVKSGARVAIVGMKDDALASDLEKLGATVRDGAPRGEVEVILFRVATEGELGRTKALAEKLAPDGALWVVRPKGKGGVDEHAMFAAGRGAGLVDVKVVRWSEVDTGMKFVRPLASRAKAKSPSPQGAKAASASATKKATPGKTAKRRSKPGPAR